MLELEQTNDPRNEKLREYIEAQLVKIEGQTVFTAVMTDTWINEEEEGGVEDDD